MSETEADVHDEWGVIGPGGRMWAYQSAAVARTVAREQHKDLHHRTVTRGPWVRVAPAPAGDSGGERGAAPTAADDAGGQ